MNIHDEVCRWGRDEDMSELPKSALQIGNIPGNHIAAEECIQGGSLILRMRIVQDFSITAHERRVAKVEPRRYAGDFRPAHIHRVGAPSRGALGHVVTADRIFLLTQKVRKALITICEGHDEHCGHQRD